MAASEKRLLASIHDVGPGFMGEVDRLMDLLGRHLGGSLPALLVVPDHWGKAPVAGNAAFQQRLRDWHESGAEIFLHGWFHRDDAAHEGQLAHFKARHVTAGEGEFLGLDRGEALRRMLAGRKLLEDIIGAPLAGFVAPAWLYGPGARSALAEAGFAIAEDHFRVWRPADGTVLARGPVITWASRSRSLASPAMRWRRCRPCEWRFIPATCACRRCSTASIAPSFFYFADGCPDATAISCPKNDPKAVAGLMREMRTGAVVRSTGRADEVHRSDFIFHRAASSSFHASTRSKLAALAFDGDLRRAVDRDPHTA